jgi:hypothetical protein
MESLQIRFVVDPSGTDDPSQFTIISSIGVCDTGVPATVRDVRLQVVSRTNTSDRTTDASRYRVSYSTPAWEGTSPAAAASGATTDQYPRRAFSGSIVPRSLQGWRL